MHIRTILTGAAGAGLLLTALPAAAATVVGATRIDITSAAFDYIQIAEVEAFELDTGDNVASAAEGGSATALASGFGGTPAGAIDGNAGTGYGAHFYHSRTSNADEKLTITLARVSTLASLRIVGRSDCCHGRDAWNVAIFDAGDNVLYSGVLDARGNEQTFDAIVTFDRPATGGGGVPEPGTWALMILGFGAAGSAIRSRRRQAVPG